MKKTLLLLFALADAAIMAQNGMPGGHVSDFISLDTIIPFHNEKTSAYTDLTYSKWGDEVAFTNFSSRDMSDTITIYHINSSTLSLDTIRLYMKGLYNAMGSYHERNLPALIYSPGTILVQYADNLVVFKKHGKLTYEKEEAWRFKENFSDLQLLNDSTLVGVNFYYSQPEAFTLFLFNINKGKVVRKITPSCGDSSLLLSYFKPFDIIDVWDGMIALTERGRYIVRFYDEMLTCVDSIVLGGKDWTSFSTGIVDRVKALNKYYAADIIDLLSSEYDSVDKIQHIFFMGGDKIAISHAYKTSAGAPIQPRLDIWRKTPAGWDMIEESLFDDGFLIKDSVYRRNRTTIGLGSSNKICFMANGKIVVLSKKGNGVDSPVGMTMKEYGKKVNDYLLDNAPYVQCLIFSHTFNTETE